MPMMNTGTMPKDKRLAQTLSVLIEPGEHRYEEATKLVRLLSKPRSQAQPAARRLSRFSPHQNRGRTGETAGEVVPGETLADAGVHKGRAGREAGCPPGCRRGKRGASTNRSRLIGSDAAQS